MPIAINFADASSLTEHFVKHGLDFGVNNEQEYLTIAIKFLNSPITPGCDIEERQRTLKGVLVDTWVRYNHITNEFAIVYGSGEIVTYFKPLMFSLAPPGTFRKDAHTCASNYDYFLRECTK